jgi:hypothetical protein
MLLQNTAEHPPNNMPQPCKQHKKKQFTAYAGKCIAFLQQKEYSFLKLEFDERCVIAYKQTENLTLMFDLLLRCLY